MPTAIYSFGFRHGKPMAAIAQGMTFECYFVGDQLVIATWSV